MIAAPPGIIPLAGDSADLQLAAYGLRRGDTPRLRSLLERTRQQAELVIRRRMREGLPLARLSYGWTWRRSTRTWVVRDRFDVEAHGTPSSAQLRERCPTRKRLGSSCVDVANLIAGSIEMLAGETVVISAIDFDRETFSFDHVALVRADGSLGELVRALPGRIAKEHTA